MKFLLVFAVLSTAVSTKETISPRCFRIDSGRCSFCYKSKPLFDKPGCTEEVPGEKCLFYKNVENKKAVCRFCQKDYVIKTISGKRTCIPAKVKVSKSDKSINSCVVNMLVGDQATCYICKNNLFAYYDSKTKESSCIAGDDKRIKQKEPNCAWGGLNSSGKARCFICNPGFVSNGNDHCIADSKLQGCLIGSDSQCLFCDAFQGYAATSDKKCVKTQ